MVDEEKSLWVGLKVQVTNDGGGVWRIGQVLAVEKGFLTVGFYNPNSGDQSIGVYDYWDDETIIELLEEVESEWS